MILSLLLLLTSAVVQAAQDGKVTQPEVAIHEAPSTDSPVLNRVSQGDLLRMSFRPSRGWYKVQLPQPIGSTRFGYIQSQNIEPDTSSHDLRVAGIIPNEPVERESDQRPWQLRGFYEFHILTPTELMSQIGSSSPIALGHAFGGEFGRMFDNGIFFGARGGYSIASASASAASFSLAMPFAELAFDYEFFYHYPFAIAAGMTAGAAFVGQITGTNASGTDLAGSFIAAPVGSARLWAVYYIGAAFGVSLGVGFRALYAPVATLAGSNTSLWLGGGFAQSGIILRF